MDAIARNILEQIRRKDTATLWTIQSPECWEKLQRQGFLQADGRRVWREFRPPYLWMMEQMRRRLPGYSKKYPLWAWYYPKPDLRDAHQAPRGVQGVRIEFSIPANRILLSDCFAWNVVLDRRHLPLSDEEETDWISRLPAKWTSYPDLDYEELDPDLQRHVATSWERIFDFELLYSSSNWGDGAYSIQAVFEEIQLDDVIRVTPFVGR